MRLFLSDKQWQKAASLLVGMYTLCVIGPAVAIAFSDSAISVNCLIDDHHETVKIHVHKDGLSHRHSIPRNDHDQAEKCCGLFGPIAIAPAIDFVVEPKFHTSRLTLQFASMLSGRSSDRIDRPPRSRSSL